MLNMLKQKFNITNNSEIALIDDLDENIQNARKEDFKAYQVAPSCKGMAFFEKGIREWLGI